MDSPMLPEGKLDVELIKGQDTKGTEFDGMRLLGKADPYCIIKIGDLDRQSKVCKDAGSKPVWNETITFELNTSDSKYSELTISLFNKNSRFGRSDTSLGESRIDLARLVAEKGNSIPADLYPVVVRGKNTQKQYGWIHVGFNFTPAPNASEEDNRAGDAAFGNPASGGTAELSDKLNSTKDETSSNPLKVNSDSSQGNAIPKKGDIANDEALGSSSAADGRGKSESGKEEDEENAGKEEDEEGEGNSGTSTEPKVPAESEEDEEGAGNSGTSTRPTVPAESEEDEEGVGNSGTSTKPKVPAESEEDEEGAGNSDTSTKPRVPEKSEEDEEGAGNSDTSTEPRVPVESEYHSTHHQDGDKTDRKEIEKGPTVFGGLCSAASSILEASKDLGRKFSYKYAALPSLVIACLLFAAVKRTGRDVHGSGENSDHSDAAFPKTETWRGSGGIPSATRQKILFYKIYGIA